MLRVADANQRGLLKLSFLKKGIQYESYDVCDSTLRNDF